MMGQKHNHEKKVEKEKKVDGNIKLGKKISSSIF
jgi:hypothetical protein